MICLSLVFLLTGLENNGGGGNSTLRVHFDIQLCDCVRSLSSPVIEAGKSCRSAWWLGNDKQHYIVCMADMMTPVECQSAFPCGKCYSVLY